MGFQKKIFISWHGPFNGLTGPVTPAYPDVCCDAFSSDNVCQETFDNLVDVVPDVTDTPSCQVYCQVLFPFFKKFCYFLFYPNPTVSHFCHKWMECNQIFNLNKNLEYFLVATKVQCKDKQMMCEVPSKLQNFSLFYTNKNNNFVKCIWGGILFHCFFHPHLFSHLLCKVGDFIQDYIFFNTFSVHFFGRHMLPNLYFWEMSGFESRELL